MKALRLGLAIILIFATMALAGDGYNVITFNGDEETYTTIGNTAISNQSVGTELLASRLTSTDHGFQAGSNILVTGTTYYDGLRYINAVAANTVDIKAKYIAETPAGTETLRSALYFTQPYEVYGFNLHLSSASATSENLVVSVDAYKGSAYDVTVYSVDMNTVQNIEYRFDPPLKLEAKDVLNFAWNNTNDRTYGIKVWYKVAE